MQAKSIFFILLVLVLAVNSFFAQAQSCSGTAIFNVTISPLPSQPSAISGSVTPCVGSQAYSITNVSGLSYAWSATGGTITGGQGTSNVTVSWTGTGAQTLTVTPSNTCGNGTDRQQAITVSTTPSQPSAISGSTTPCVGSQAYSITNVSGLSYAWSATGGTITGGQGTSSVTVSWTGTGAQTLTVTPSNTCGNGTNRQQAITVSTTPSQPSAISGSSTVCSDAMTQNYNVTGVGGVTYTWSTSGGTISSGQGTNAATLNWTGSGSQTLMVIPSNTCGNGTAQTLAVTIKQVPTPVISGNNGACGSVTETYTIPATAGHTYLWSVSANGSIVSGQGTNSVTVIWNSGSVGSVTVVETNP